MITFTQNNRRKLFIAYDHLLQDPRRECTRLCHFLDEQCGVSPQDADRRIDSMTSQIATDQRHFQHPSSLADIGTSTREQRALYDFLRVKTMYPDEEFNEEDFAPYPGWQEYLQAMETLASFTREPEG
jgi:hypothetical protein